MDALGGPSVSVDLLAVELFLHPPALGLGFAFLGLGPAEADAVAGGPRVLLRPRLALARPAQIDDLGQTPIPALDFLTKSQES